MSENITTQDLKLAVEIIDICSKRGSFEGSELATVGALREKFSVFIKSIETAKTQEETVETTE